MNRPAPDQPDLSSCAREPIHVPGHIQPHGVLIATAPGGRRITHLSANFERLVGTPPAAMLGRDLGALFEPDGLAALEASLDSEHYAPCNVLDLALRLPGSPTRKALVHRHLDRVIVELEEAPADEQAAVSLPTVQRIISGLRDAATMDQLCARTVGDVRQLTGCDRVMMYRFDAGGHGSVIAESAACGLEPFLGLHYPASDIPEQARRLYVLQRVRAIPDVDYVSVPLLALPGAEGETGAGDALDMTYCALRGISPLHREYLHNMGVKATLAISLLHDGRLWGMIICHHGTRLVPTANTLAVCDVIGQLVSLLLLKVCEVEELADRLARHHAVAGLREDIDASDGIAHGLSRRQGALLRLMGATGAVVRCGGATSLLGDTPPLEEALAMMAAMRAAHAEEIACVEDAGCPGGLAALFPRSASGILLMPIAHNPGDAIAWFRPEVVQTVLWGGDPRKPVHITPEGSRISPRRSFAAWRELQRGRSAPWSAGDLLAAHELRRMVTAALLQQAEARLVQLAAFDPLTGLSNRRTLNAQMERWRSGSSPSSAALLFLDLDRFKTINDSLGHAAGDEILTQVAARLCAVAPEASTAGRLGGDEFVLLWPGCQRHEAEALAARLVHELARPFVLLGQPHHAGASIGIAWCPPGAASDLMREADSAMYAAKRQGGGQAITFQPSLHVAVLTTLQLEQDLFRALENDELLIHYQPLVTVPQRTVHGFEALLRWRHPERGWISPAEFIPCAEESGLIGRIGAWVLAGAVRQVGAWRRLQPALKVSVNVSARQLSDGALGVLMAGILAREGVPASALSIEVTESALMHESAIAELRRLRALGVGVSIDDFGTGYSSLSYLQDLPVDTVKIDQSFVARLGSGRSADRFFAAIVEMARTLELGTVAEGCETEDQWRAIAATRCDLVQGWLIARALDPVEAERLLTPDRQARPGALPPCSSGNPAKGSPLETTT